MTSNPNETPIELVLDKKTLEALQPLILNWHTLMITQGDSSIYLTVQKASIQLTAYQLLVQKQVGEIETISEKLQTLEDQVEEWENDNPAMEI